MAIYTADPAKDDRLRCSIASTWKVIQAGSQVMETSANQQVPQSRACRYTSQSEHAGNINAPWFAVMKVGTVVRPDGRDEFEGCAGGVSLSEPNLEI